MEDIVPVLDTSGIETAKVKVEPPRKMIQEITIDKSRSADADAWSDEGSVDKRIREGLNKKYRLDSSNRSFRRMNDLNGSINGGSVTSSIKSKGIKTKDVPIPPTIPSKDSGDPSSNHSEEPSLEDYPRSSTTRVSFGNIEFERDHEEMISTGDLGYEDHTKPPPRRPPPKANRRSTAAPSMVVDTKHLSDAEGEMFFNVNPGEDEPEGTTWTTWGIRCACLLLAVAMVVISAVYAPHEVEEQETQAPTIRYQPGGTNPPNITEAPAQGPVLSPAQNYILTLFPPETLAAIEGTKPTPQQFAFEWSVEDLQINYLLSDQRLRQRYAMATFYYATQGSSWFKADLWLSHTTHECQWYSIHGLSNNPFSMDLTTNNSTCVEDPQDIQSEGFIAHLRLQYNNLDGSLPLEFFWLTRLQSINFDGCNLGGEFPKQFSALEKLRALGLLSNRFEGTLPPSMFHMDLVELSLSSNRLTGTLPTQIGLASLTWVRMHSNKFNGKIPSEFGAQYNLEMLELQSNDLTGTIPIELAGIASLEVMLLQNNNLSGYVPVGLCSHTVFTCTATLCGCDCLCFDDTNSSRFDFTPQPTIQMSPPRMPPPPPPSAVPTRRSNGTFFQIIP